MKSVMSQYFLALVVILFAIFPTQAQRGFDVVKVTDGVYACIRRETPSLWFTPKFETSFCGASQHKKFVFLNYVTLPAVATAELRQEQNVCSSRALRSSLHGSDIE